MSAWRKKRRSEKKLELIGWYHSHPDAPARPSEFDREHAWPWYSYIIVSVQKGEPRDTTSWRLHDDRAAYDPEEIEIVVAYLKQSNRARPLREFTKEECEWQ